ncbi:ankyrin repeat-containing domain protein, partial [Leptodontidium sp. 2 PMI_412]
MKAVQIGNTSMVILLLQNGANIAERNDTGQTSLHIAALNENLEMIQVLLDKGIYVDAKDDKNMSALHYAATTGNEAISRILIQHSAGTS